MRGGQSRVSQSDYQAGTYTVDMFYTDPNKKTNLKVVNNEKWGRAETWLVFEDGFGP
jgi:hypothetical protein